MTIAMKTMAITAYCICSPVMTIANVLIKDKAKLSIFPNEANLFFQILQFFKFEFEIRRKKSCF